jgi:hypothetical protein
MADIPAWNEGYYLGPVGFKCVALALVINRGFGDRLDTEVLDP